MKSLGRMFSQLIGDPSDTSNEGNIYSALEFNADGDFLASGDRGGRVVVYERNHHVPQKVSTADAILPRCHRWSRHAHFFCILTGVCYGLE